MKENICKTIHLCIRKRDQIKKIKKRHCNQYEMEIKLISESTST